MMIIDNELLDVLTKEAKSTKRLRKNFNFHKTLNDNVQRLLNALEPGTIMPIHRHINTDETYFVIRGRLRVIVYNDNKELVSSTELNPLEGNYGVNIAAGQWHTIEVLESGTVIFEVKEGPYKPLESKDTL
jgi:cupin fold WbuC family metalloprotein